MTIRIAETEAEIRRCWPVLRQLRPHLTEAQFVAQVQRQREQVGFVLAYVEGESEIPNPKSQADSPPNPPAEAEGDPIRAVAGFRVTEFLAWGKVLYVDDLIADEATRGQGYASRLYDWLMEYARRAGCDQLHLDSGAGPHRYRAHRFYLVKGMDITSHHFAKTLKD